MEFKLNEDQQMIHDLAKDLCGICSAAPVARDRGGERTEVSNGQKHPQLPHDIHQQLAECGFIGISFPESSQRHGRATWSGHCHQGARRVSPSVASA